MSGESVVQTGAASLFAFCGVELRVLPDFLLDHSLQHAEVELRLPELLSRWVQLIERLGAWRETLFCLRLDHQPQTGATGVFLLARPHNPARRDELQRDLEFALRAYGVLGEERDYRRYLPLLTPAQIAALDLPPDAKSALADEVTRKFSAMLAPPARDAAFVGLTQEVSATLWHNQAALKTLTDDGRLYPGGNNADRGKPQRAWLPLNWEGPSGPFVLPFKALFTGRVPLRVSVYLQPCQVEDHERLWLEKLTQAVRRDAATLDPIVELASRRAASAARRLLNSSFLVAVECVARDGSLEAATRVAEVLRALSQETPAGVADAAAALPGTRIVRAGPAMSDAARTAHAALEFPRWMDDLRLPGYAVRLSFLADARGAATLFRLPVSIRSGVPGVEVAQAAPDFNPGPHDGEAGAEPRPIYRPARAGPRIVLGRFEAAGEAAIPLDDLTKHALVTGFTGTGKTKTVLHLLHQLWVDHGIPFLVIESAKSEYRGLLPMRDFQPRDGRPGLLIFTAGNEQVSPLRINPFELLPGVRVEAHVNRLKTCFEAALPPFGPLASILEQSLIDVYADKGFRMTWPRHDDRKAAQFPTMRDFAAKLKAVAKDRGYVGEFAATLQAAISGRIMPLTRDMGASKGSMLDTPHNWPSGEVLFGGPVILEMNDLNEQDKALLSMFLLTLLREHRERQHRAEALQGIRGLRHVTVIEEAHNVLQNVDSVAGSEGGGADTRYQAVQAFCAMLTEIRSLGEGIIIADQSPLKLASDAMRNTNLQIAHGLRDSRDRRAIANAMIMTDEQRDYLGRVSPGRAGVFYTGLQKASFISVPQFDDPLSGRGREFSMSVTDNDVSRSTAWLNTGVKLAGLKPQFLAAVKESRTVGASMVKLAPLLAEAAARLGSPGSADAAWTCLMYMRREWTRWPPDGAFDRTGRAAFLRCVVPLLTPAPDPRAKRIEGAG